MCRLPIWKSSPITLEEIKVPKAKTPLELAHSYVFVLMKKSSIKRYEVSHLLTISHVRYTS